MPSEPGKGAKDEDRLYSYGQLVDLHDKLTLVVGKDVEQQNIIKYFEDVRIIIHIQKKTNKTKIKIIILTKFWFLDFFLFLFLE